jgi:hypothetical protein
MWQFEEFGYDVELNNDRLGIKPTKWEYLDDPERIRLFNLYKAMINLKENHKAFNSPDNTILNLTQPLKSIRLIDGDFQVLLHGNFGLTDVNNANLSFPTSGVWYNYFTGEEVNVTGNSKIFRLRANQFMLFTNQKLEMPEGEILEDPILSIGPENIDLSGFKLYPVPSSDILKITVPEAVNQFNFRILNAAGVVLKEGVYFEADNNLQVDIREFTAGIYIFEISDNRQVLRKRFIKQ